ncbi:hypothetical protein AJ78_05926 [Emergomyces pasteurianus Ep9510]|uniref:Uncharacterized protein n=1 Tax=Emergomyces pasteurianus Ep9510 TaxID=1447872 RepID=A0A1J9QEN6_9EURO|nr:hypothetical protein AJ78_05926 [Emergomyces pasteurianus Ep9510]
MMRTEKARPKISKTNGTKPKPAKFAEHGTSTPEQATPKSMDREPLTPPEPTPQHIVPSNADMRAETHHTQGSFPENEPLNMPYSVGGYVER